MTSISSHTISVYQKSVFLIAPVLFLMSGFLSMGAHPIFASLQMTSAAIMLTIWLRVVRNYRDVYSTGSSLVVEEGKSRTVVDYGAILKVTPIYYLRASVFVIAYRSSSKIARLYFVAI